MLFYGKEKGIVDWSYWRYTEITTIRATFLVPFSVSLFSQESENDK